MRSGRREEGGGRREEGGGRREEGGGRREEGGGRREEGGGRREEGGGEEERKEEERKEEGGSGFLAMSVLQIPAEGLLANFQLVSLNVTDFSGLCQEKIQQYANFQPRNPYLR